MNHSFFFFFHIMKDCIVASCARKKKTTSSSEATLVAYSTNRVKIERHCKTGSLHEQIL